MCVMMGSEMIICAPQMISSAQTKAGATLVNHFHKRERRPPGGGGGGGGVGGVIMITSRNEPCLPKAILGRFQNNAGAAHSYAKQKYTAGRWQKHL